MKIPTSEHAKRKALEVWLVPTAPLARRICAIMHRRSACSVKEVAAYKAIARFVNFDHLVSIERMYSTLWPPSEKNYLRRKLITLLHNWFEEEIKADQWCQRHPIREKKIIDFPPVEGNAHVESVDPEQLARFQQEREQRSAFRKAREAMGK